MNLKSISIPIEHFCKIWESCSKDETRFVLNGVNVKHTQGDGFIKLCGTDGRKLTEIKIPITHLPDYEEGNNFEFNLIIHRDTFKLPIQFVIIEQVEDKETECGISIKAKAILKGSTTGYADLRLIDGRFPLYDDSEKGVTLIVSKPFDYRICLNQKYLKELLKTHAESVILYFREGEMNPLEIRDLQNPADKFSVLMPMKFHEHNLEVHPEKPTEENIKPLEEMVS